MSVSSGCLIREAQPGVDDEAVAALMVEYLTWAIDRLADDYGVDEPPTHPSLVRDGLVNYRPPVGRLLLAECDGQPVGVGALRTLRTGVAEVKRMYVAPDWRNRHVGSAILDRLLDQAGEMGATHRTPGHMSVHDQRAAAVSLTRFRGASSVRGHRDPYRGLQASLDLLRTRGTARLARG